MSSTRRKGASGPSRVDGAPVKPVPQSSTHSRVALLVVVLVLAAAVVIATDFVFGAISSSSGSSASATPTAAPAATSSQAGVVGQGKGGDWTNVTADQLASMLPHKDFMLVNVKTPYIGEIGADLYIPYDQIATKATALPANRTAGILVYCRSGTERAIAAQTLIHLRYTKPWNLDGDINAWQACGRTLVQKNR